MCIRDSSNPAPAVPAPPTFARTPSPGLLKRMASIESVHNTSSTAQQGEYGRTLPVVEKSGLRKSSVDDLKRIYEERAGLARAASVSSVGSGRRASNASLSRRTSNAAA